jgi:transposase
VEATTPSIGVAFPHLAPSQRWLKKGLAERERTVILMLDEVIITETPPLVSCYGRRGQPVVVPITGNRSKRILHGVINIGSGDVALLITKTWTQATHQTFLHIIRDHWRGWQIVLFEDRASSHTAGQSTALAKSLGIEIRWLPRATPELNAMDHLWHWVKGRGLANRPTLSIDDSAHQACQYLLAMSPQERLRKAGILSGNFWLTA